MDQLRLRASCRRASSLAEQEESVWLSRPDRRWPCHLLVRRQVQEAEVVSKRLPVAAEALVSLPPDRRRVPIQTRSGLVGVRATILRCN